MKALSLKLAAALGLVLAYGTWRQGYAGRRTESRREHVNRSIDEALALGGAGDTATASVPYVGRKAAG